MSLTGELGEVAFSDVIQLCGKIRSSGALLLTAETGEAIGTFWFENGELVDAQLGTLGGADAVYRALEVTEGIYRFDFGLRARERRIFASIESLLIEGIPRMEESAATAAAGGRYQTRSQLAPVASKDPPLQLVPTAQRQVDTNNKRGMGMTRSALAEWSCPICSRHFETEGECPDHHTPLIRRTGTRTFAASGGLAPEPSPHSGSRGASPAWVAVTLAALAVGIVAIVALKIGRAPRPQPSAPARAVATVAVGEPPSPAAPVAAPAVHGVTDNEIRFGMAAPFSGPAKELGRQMKMGIEAAFNAANDAGGIAGRRLILVAADDGYEPARTVEVMKDLRDKKDVFGFVGNVGTPTAAVALPVALERKMLFFGAFTGANLLRHDPPDRYVFNFRASYTEETAAVVRYLIKVRHLRPESIAVFAQQDAFGDAGFQGVTRAVRELRPDFRGTLRIGYQRNTTDVREAVATLNARSRSTPIKAIVMVATYRAAARFIEKVRDLYPKMIFTNVSFVGSTALAEELKLLGHRYASGVIVTQVVPPVERFSTAILKYKEALNRYFPGEKADYVSLEGFWAASVLIEGVRRTGRDIDSERLVDALEGIHDLDLGLGTPLTFGLEEHQASHRVWGTQINEDGVYEEIDLQ